MTDPDSPAEPDPKPGRHRDSHRDPTTDPIPDPAGAAGGRAPLSAEPAPQDARPLGAAPPGYQLHTRKSPLTEPWEPILARWRDDAVDLAVQVRRAHCNGRGFAHGGLIAALADNAMGYSAARVAQAADGVPPKGAVTVSLALDYVGSARQGEWLEIHPTVLRAGRSLAFVECRVVCGTRIVARGSATFKFS
jgi:uncharacterized protein (TIGR00369 family)